jgi:hypothetical protein
MKFEVNAVFFFYPQVFAEGMLQTLMNGVRLAGSKVWIFSANSFNLSKKKRW